MKPCKRCGAADRNNSGDCRPCAKVNAAKWYAENHERIKEKNAAWRTANPDRMKELTASWRAMNPSRVKAYYAKYNAANPEKNKASVEKWQANNPDRIKENASRYRAENKEKIKANGAKWYAENTEKARLAAKKWAAANTERIKAKLAKWAAANPAKRKVAEHKRRAQKRAAGGSFTADDIKKMLKLQKGKCVVCKVNILRRYHIDHIMPLSLGGHNGIQNIQLLCPTCNLRKSAKHPIDFMQENGFLL